MIDDAAMQYALNVMKMYGHWGKYRGTSCREIFSKFYQIKPKSGCIYHFPIDLDPNGGPFGSKSIGKWLIQSDFGFI